MFFEKFIIGLVAFGYCLVTVLAGPGSNPKPTSSSKSASTSGGKSDSPHPWLAAIFAGYGKSRHVGTGVFISKQHVLVTFRTPDDYYLTVRHGTFSESESIAVTEIGFRRSGVSDTIRVEDFAILRLEKDAPATVTPINLPTEEVLTAENAKSFTTVSKVGADEDSAMYSIITPKSAPEVVNCTKFKDVPKMCVKMGNKITLQENGNPLVVNGDTLAGLGFYPEHLVYKKPSREYSAFHPISKSVVKWFKLQMKKKTFGLPAVYNIPISEEEHLFNLLEFQNQDDLV